MWEGMKRGFPDTSPNVHTIASGYYRECKNTEEELSKFLFPLKKSTNPNKYHAAPALNETVIFKK